MNPENIRVVILAGGKGTRLKPYTNVFPKPLMPIGDIPILEVVLRQLKYFGFKKITLSVNHMADLIKNFFENGSKFGLQIEYCIEDTPLGTAGSLSLVENLTDNFLVMNGDLLTTLNYASLVKRHISSGAEATIGAFLRNVKIDFGVIEVNEDSQLQKYCEKPQFDYLVSMGVNCFSKVALKYIEKNKYLDIPTLMIRLKESGYKVLTYREECQWLDIGRPDDYKKAVNIFEEKKKDYLHED